MSLLKLQNLAPTYATVPNRAEVTQALLEIVRTGLTNAIQDGFVFMLGVGILAVLGAFLISNIRLDSHPVS